MTTKLICRILSLRDGVGSPNYHYGVFEGRELVADGISSSLAWVRNDAGGYHTKSRFDERYPNGWEVEFDFEGH